MRKSPSKNKTFLLVTCSSTLLAAGFGVRAYSQTTPSPSPSPSASASASPSPSVSPSASPSPSSSTTGTPREVFTATLAPVNPGVGESSGSVTGTAAIVVDGERIGAYVNANGLYPNVPHAVDIHTGSTCPTASADTNGDGFVDIQEADTVNGGSLVNIGADLNSFATAMNFIPSADGTGNLALITSGTLSSLNSDLHRTSPNPATGEVTLPSGRNLNLGEYTIVIHGINSSVQLPNTVATVSGFTANQTLPVACGSLTLANPQPSASPSVSPSPSASPSTSPSPSPSVSPSAAQS
jgi:hypothetical protein